ncbi:hypothetical protein BV20DRAFT_424470 [Pilatotrama ljubarskyi]|nr:hypothetical protein BV20DRAFT_424470 [Pilatotrama ljubarskyi]
MMKMWTTYFSFHRRDGTSFIPAMHRRPALSQVALALGCKEAPMMILEDGSEVSTRGTFTVTPCPGGKQPTRSRYISSRKASERRAKAPSQRQPRPLRASIVPEQEVFQSISAMPRLHDRSFEVPSHLGIPLFVCLHSSYRCSGTPRGVLRHLRHPHRQVSPPRCSLAGSERGGVDASSTAKAFPPAFAPFVMPTQPQCAVTVQPLSKLERQADVPMAQGVSLPVRGHVRNRWWCLRAPLAGEVWSRRHGVVFLQGSDL